MNKKNIRNFSIIAHIDHGKSTLADRILEICNSVSKREMKAQMLDSMELERERGITIKLNAVQLKYKDERTGEDYIFNLIDTPGHVDFSYEVSRSLACSEGAILVVDSTQGVQPQTIANMYLAIENNLAIVPVINKIDMPAADVEGTKKDIEETLGIDASNAALISAKNGLNIKQVLEHVIDNVPYPDNADDSKPLRALVFDAYFDTYRGIVMFIRLEEGKIKKGDKLKFIHSKTEFEIVDLGVNTPKPLKKDELVSGEAGWIVTNIRELKSTFVGDTLTHKDNQDVPSLPGYKPMKPMVFSGFYPVDTEKFTQLNEALDKIILSDSALVYEKETSQALGYGFRIGFLGLLHMEIVQERIRREFNIDIIATAPSVIYHVYKTNKEMVVIQNPVHLPERSHIERIEEPYVKLSLFSPQEYVGKLMEFIHQRRGIYVGMEILTKEMNALIYEIPLGEIVFDFFNTIKSISKGYASFDYEITGYKPGNLVKMDIMVHGEPVDALSVIIDREKAFYFGREICDKLKDIIPRQQFEIAIQAAIGGKIIARETVKAFRKDVTGWMSGGDVTRKKKLLEIQKEGKKKAKLLGSVEIPQEAFVAVLSRNEKK